MADAMKQNPAEEIRSRLAAIVESSDDAIISMDLDGINTSWNRAAERMYGYTAEEVLGRHISLLSPPERADDSIKILERIRGGERTEHFETVRVTKSGERIDVSLTVSPIRNQRGEIVGASKIARDVSERKRAEAALRASEKLAATGRLAAAIAHEINNPLESLTNLLYLLETNPSLDVQARSYARLAQQEIERVAQLARKALTFHREEPVAVPVSCAELIESLLELYQHKLHARRIIVEKRLESSHTIEAAPGELRQVFSNLISNAIDALPGGGRLCVHVFDSHLWQRPYQEGIRITIADNGKGIPPQIRQQVFEPFFTTKGEKGTGLGLWLAMSVVEKYGGLISLRSRAEPGRTGTSISVFFPYARKAEKSAGVLECA